MTKTIELVNGKGTVLVDDDDFVWLSEKAWRLGPRGHAVTAIWHKDEKKQRQYMMHRMIMEARRGDGRVIDHINGNPLDNRRENLRDAGISGNMRNRRRFKRCEKTGVKYKGVRKIKSGYTAVLTIGTFDTQEEAARAYDKAVRALFPDFPVNFPESDNERPAAAIREQRALYVTY